MKMMDLLHALLHPTSAAINHAIERIGFFSIGSAVTISTAQKADLIETSHAGLALADWGIIVSMIGGLIFIINRLVDTYVTLKKYNSEKKDQDTPE